MSKHVNFQDFRIAVEPYGKHRFRCRLLWSPLGYADALLTLPGAIPGGSGSERQKGEKRGEALFRALFAGRVGKKYRDCLLQLRDREDCGLRVRLIFPQTEPKIATLLEQPWEELYDPEERRFLSRGRKLTLVREPCPAPPLRPQLGGGPPRVLLAVSRACPPGWPELDVDEEARLVTEAWEGAGEIKRLDCVGMRELRRKLVGGGFHLLHFIGHGGISDDGTEGVLYLHDSGGRARAVATGEFADNLRDVPTLRLVVLNACESAETPNAPVADPARGAALALMNLGLPAVVAHRRQIRDDVAGLFAVELHRELAAGTPVDIAVAEARMAIDEQDQLFEEWKTPVLFLSAPDGKIFDFAQPWRQPCIGLTPSSPTPLRLAIRTRRHPFDDLSTDCDHLLDLLPSFDGRAIRRVEDWRSTVQTAVDCFLRKYATTRRPIELRLDTHLSVAFCAGYSLDTRGVTLTLRQATMGGFQDWRYDPSASYDGPLCQHNSEKGPASEGHDVAISVGIVNETVDDVRRYVEKNLSDRVGRLICARALPEPGNTAVRGANHAFALAEELKRQVVARTADEKAGVLHLFLAVPGSFAFYVGQLARGFGEVQLYEFEFENPGSRNYVPSLRIVPEKGGRR